MATLVITKAWNDSLKSLDRAVRGRVSDFIEKITLDAERPGLRIKPLQNARDPRARTARVDQNYRAVMFELDSASDTFYHLVGIWPHDEGNDRAATMRMKFNPVLGTTDLELEEPTDADRKRHEAEQTAAYQRGLADAVQRKNPLEKHGFTVDILVTDAGIDQRWAEAALEATDQNTIVALIDNMPEAQGLMLLELASGRNLQEAREVLDLPDTEALEALEQLEEDEQLVEGARNVPSVFSFLGDTPEEVKRAYDELTMDEWQVFLHPEQRRYVNLESSGSYRLSGGAGTGKTVILVHRAKRLWEQHPDAKILLTTFTRVLSESLGANLVKLDSQVPMTSKLNSSVPTGVSVQGIDQLARWVLNHASTAEKQFAHERVFGVGANDMTRLVQNVQRRWEEAQVQVSSQLELNPQYRHPDFLEQEYVAVILGKTLTTAKQYARAARPGRGSRLHRNARLDIWKIVEEFRAENSSQNEVTFPEMTALAAAILEHRAEQTGQYLFDHVLVDEAQDFHGGHWRLLRALVPQQASDLFIAEDSHQRIYGQKLTLKDYDINIVGRSRRLKVNYRTTLQNLEYALAMLDGQSWQALEENPDDPGELTETAGYISLRGGPNPKIIQADSPQNERQCAAEQLRTWIDNGVQPENIAVLVRTRKQLRGLGNAIAEAGIQIKEFQSEEQPPGGYVQLRTMHQAKGLEFECVLLYDVSDDVIPNMQQLQHIPEAERVDAQQRERSLLYVAASRARDELSVLWRGEPSALLPA